MEGAPFAPLHTSSKDTYEYQPGMGNHFSTEAVAGMLPKGQNSPQKPPGGLYAEQLSGTAFTVPRVHNERTWMYRIRPSVGHNAFEAGPRLPNLLSQFDEPADPNQYRWMPPALPEDDTTWIQGLHTVAGAGDPCMKAGLAVHMYMANTSMKDSAFYNADGDFLIVPQQGDLDIRTELGRMVVAPGEICVIQRGIRFAIDLDGPSRGYVCELYSGHFRIPDLGPIGSNGLANPRDFQTPVAWFEDHDCDFTVVAKFGGSIHHYKQDHSCFDVVAWHGNYAPYKYDLALFNCINSVTFDHPDPSIYTVLTCPTTEPGVAACDFVVFPPRWMVAENTFRPPWFHRNLMSEYMGLISGGYDAKSGGGFVPGGSSLHSCMSPHGPDVKSFEGATAAELKPVRYKNEDLAFMFESTYILRVTEWAHAAKRDNDYHEHWKGFEPKFRQYKKE